MTRRIVRGLVCLITIPLFLAFGPHDDPNVTPDSSANAAPVGIGQGGPFATERIQVFGHLTLSEIGGGPANIFATDLWGWTDPLDGSEYAICGLEHGTSFVDITDPVNPLYLGFLPSHTGAQSPWRDVKVFDNHAFIVADSNPGHGVQVFDLTQLRSVNPGSPMTFSNSAHYDGIGSAHNIAINEDSGFAYVVGSGQANGGLHVVNIGNPTNPVFAGNFGAAGYCHDCQVVNYDGPDVDYQGREIAFCCNGRTGDDNDALVVVDVTNKNNMNTIASRGYPQPGFAHQGWLSDDQRYFFLGDEFDENIFGGRTRILVWDCVNLDNPVFLGVVEGPTNAIDHNIYIRGDKLFLSNYSAGMRVMQFDLDNPLDMEEVAFVDTFMTDNDVDFDGVWSNYPYFESGNVIISDRQNGLFVVQLTQLEFDFPNGQPDLVSPSGQVEFQVDVSGFDGEPVANTGILHVDRGNGFESFPMNEISANVYEAVFPASECGAVVSYFVSATAANGTEECIPSDAPTTFFTATVADQTTVPFEDNFQSNMGWSVSGNAAEGQWERGVPAGDGERGDPTVDGDGSGLCFLTENGAGNTDVDDGTTTLTSPTMDAIGDGSSEAAFISYYRWYSNDIGNAPAADIFVVEISNNNGQSWTNLETVGPGGFEVSGGWIAKSFLISDFVVPTDQMRIRFMASDLNDGSVVEAGVDGVEILLVSCEEDMTLLGDVNMDGVVNLLDVAPFIELIANGGFLPEADMNQDGVVNLLDVQLFIAAIAG